MEFQAFLFFSLVLPSLLVISTENDLSIFLDKSTFDEMFPNQNSSDCPSKGFYTYEAFINATKSFPDFASDEYDDETRRREISAFLAQVSVESSGYHDTDPDQDPYVWGLCILKEKYPPSDYCRPFYDCPKEYYGRGPFQLRWNDNYISLGNAVGEDLLNNPDLLVTDPVISFKSAIWFWMQRPYNLPSCHDVITGDWEPSSSEEESNGWVPGFGLTTNIINGESECGSGENIFGAQRIGYFEKYCGLLNTTTGDNLDCYDQTLMHNSLISTSLAKTM